MVKWGTKRSKTGPLSCLLLSLLSRWSPVLPHHGCWHPQPWGHPSACSSAWGFGNFYYWGCEKMLPLLKLCALPDHSRGLEGFRFWGVQMIPAIVSVTGRDGHLRNRCGICFISQDWTNPWKHALSAHLHPLSLFKLLLEIIIQSCSIALMTLGKSLPAPAWTLLDNMLQQE